MLYFRTNLNGPAVFLLVPAMCVLRVGPYEGTIAEALGAWGPRGIENIEVTADVADWLAQLP